MERTKAYGWRDRLVAASNDVTVSVHGEPGSYFLILAFEGDAPSGTLTLWDAESCRTIETLLGQRQEFADFIKPLADA